MLADKGVSVEPDETENKVTDRLLLFAKGLTRAIKTTYVMVNRDDEGSTFTLVDPAALGLLIRAVRIAAGLSQHDAAELCGVSAPFLIGVERGKPTAQIGRVLQVCAGLGIRLETRGPTPLPRDLSQAPKRKPRSRKPR